MIINSQLFEAYLKCTTKCYLKSLGETGTGNAYAEWLQAQNETYRSDGIKRIMIEAAPDSCVTNPSELKNLKKATFRLAIDFMARAQSLESMIHAVERVASEGRGKSAQFITVRYVFNNKPTKSDKLLLVFDALVLSKTVGRKVTFGKIVHGDKLTAQRFKVDSLESTVQKAIDKISKLLSAGSPPDLILNRHCVECEYQKQCRQKAIEKDELSLLARMTDKERKKFHDKGIFTITQLSYTFRPRRRPRRMKDKHEKYHHALKALAIRKKKIHIVGTPELRIEGTPVYLDVEGLPDSGFYYLIGVRFKRNDTDCQYSLWADNEEDEKKIWSEFLDLLETVENPVLICYGNYEKVFLKEMCERYGELEESSPLSAIIKNPLNLLLKIYARIYFPAYSNGLKDIAGLLGFKWTELNASGIQSIIWRKGWVHTGDPSLKEKLIIYNSEDCEALAGVTDCLSVLTSKRNLSNAKPIDVVNTDNLPRYNLYKFQNNVFAMTELDEINNAAYWDYQREKILLRSNKQLDKIARAALKKVGAQPRVNKIIHWPAPSRCPLCGEPKLYKHQTYVKIVSDVKFSQFGVKKWIIKYLYYRYRCTSCNAAFQNPDRPWTGDKFGPNIQALTVYLNIDLRLSLNGVAVFLNQILGYNCARAAVQRFKGNVAAEYKHTCDRLLQKIVSGPLVHADETSVNSDKGIGYVWVFTSLEEVVFIYAPTREGELLTDLLKDFKGVLVSDFYTAYDSLNCPQQKCLIHLIRDLNETLCKEPFNEEFKSLVADFAYLVKPIIETIDRFGLKTHFLRKHKIFVDRFFKRLAQTHYDTEAAAKCKSRLEKNRDKLFTFLDYDGVPWNNNNAEHAIKPFALLRRGFSGVTTENGLRDYLILLSICETCKYKGLDFLDFLRSGEKDIDAFAQRKTRRRQLLW